MPLIHHSSFSATALQGATLQGLAAGSKGQVRPGCCHDIAPVFNLIQLGCEHGHFSNLYLQPRYRAGLAMQLFAVCLLGRIPLPGGRWQRAKLLMSHDGLAPAGFTILVEMGSPVQQEIYMCAVRPELQRAGFGRAMLKTVLDGLPARTRVQADCLPASVAMKRLLHGLGFKPVAGVRHARQAPQRFERAGIQVPVPSAGD